MYINNLKEIIILKMKDFEKKCDQKDLFNANDEQDDLMLRFTFMALWR